jgi:hypothetical protein
MDLTHEIKTAFHNLDETQFAEEIGKFARALQELHESQWGILGKKCLNHLKCLLLNGLPLAYWSMLGNAKFSRIF